MAGRAYSESFDQGPGGWIGWDGSGAARLEIDDGVAISRSPWWVDYNHAPPGGGYLHLLFCLHTHPQSTTRAELQKAGGVNRFVRGGFPTDFTRAKMTLRLRGEVEQRGAALALLVQARVGDFFINHVLMAQPFAVAPDWSEQTINLEPDPQQWKCMGSRHDRMDFYGWGEIADVLRDVNGDIILVFHLLDVVPSRPVDGDPHRLRADVDYQVDRSRLPQGSVMLDEVRIEFAGA
jgi:hypothetical protein